MKPFLVLACLALLSAIAIQDWLVPVLRNKTISSGLTGPYHWWLDATYFALAVALVGTYRHHPGMELLATVAALALCLTAVTNSFHGWWDAHIGDHSLWHSRFTVVVFVFSLGLELAGANDWLIWVTALNVALPTALYVYLRFVGWEHVAASPAAEKAAVLLITAWLILSSL